MSENTACVPIKFIHQDLLPEDKIRRPRWFTLSFWETVQIPAGFLTHMLEHMEDPLRGLIIQRHGLQRSGYDTKVLQRMSEFVRVVGVCGRRQERCGGQFSMLNRRPQDLFGVGILLILLKESSNTHGVVEAHCL